MLRLCLLLVCLLCTCVLAAQTETVNYRNWEVGSDQRDKIALVIGNGQYGKGRDLSEPAKNAEQMARALKRQGYDVEIGYNLDRAALETAVRQFALRFKEYQEALIYYAGHGSEVNGENYIIPIGANPPTPLQMESEFFNVDRIFDLMESGVDKPKLVVMDACRENPFAKDTLKNVLYRMNFEPKSVASLRNASIVFSTMKTKEVLDNNLFTPFFAELIEAGGCLEDILREVTARVRDADLNQLIDRVGILERQICFGTVDMSNASISDTDGDGVFDDKDACVLASGPEACSGCPMVSTLVWRDRVDAPGTRAYFLEAEASRLRRIDNAAARARLGYLYRQGLGREPNEQLARNLFEEAKGTDGFAEYNLAMLALAPLSGPTNKREGLKYLQEGARLGDPFAAYNLGVWWNKEGNTRADKQRALENFQLAADRGFIPAYAMVGEYYQFVEKPQNLNIALDYYQRGAYYEDPRALTNLARMYAEAQGVGTRDLDKAIELYEQAITVGSVRAMKELADLLYNERAGSEDKLRAKQLLEEGCTADDGEACWALGNLYHKEKKREEALKIHKRALELGEVRSREYLEKHGKQ